MDAIRIAQTLAFLTVIAWITPVSSRAEAPRLERLSSERTGITFTNTLPEHRHLTNQLFLDGSGVAAGDVDGDGRADLFFAGLDGRSSLWINQGDWRFEDRTAAAGLALGGLHATGCVLADLSGNGELDLVVNTHGQGTHLFRNEGGGRFQPWTVLNPARGGHTLAVADVDGDGWLDLYVCNYRVKALMDMPTAHAQLKVVRGRTVVASVDGRPTTAPDLTNRFVVTVAGSVEELGEPDVLYLNQGGTNFVAVPWTGGAFRDEAGRVLDTPPFDWGLAAMFRDLTGNGRPDLFVANDFQSEDRLWLNTSTPGQVRFQLAHPLALRHTSHFSMGIDFGDLNRDGYDDLMVIDMWSPDHVLRLTQVEDQHPVAWGARVTGSRPQYGVNTLFLGGPDGWRREIAAYAGVQATDWSWSVIFLDVDLDGYEDILVGNGQERAARDADVAAAIADLRRQRRLGEAELFALRKHYPRYASPNLAFRNRGDLTFESMEQEWGFDWASVTHGMALADLDGDGDLDVVMNDFNDVAGIYRNNSVEPRLAVRLKGQGGNTRGIGARIRVSGGPVEQSQEMIAGGRYLSSDDPIRVFAAGNAKEMTVEIDWPSGRQSRLTGVQPGHLCVVEEALATNRVSNRSQDLAMRFGQPTERVLRPTSVAADGSARLPWFVEVPDLPTQRGGRDPPDATHGQALILRQTPSYGGGLSWVRSGEDRLELIVPGEAGGSLRVYDVNKGKDGAVTWKLRGEHPTSELQTALIPHADGWLIASQSFGAQSAASGRGLTLLDTQSLAVKPLRLLASKPSPTSAGSKPSPFPNDSVGTLALADYDMDGALDLFVGGQTSVGNYPAPADAWLIQSTPAGWVLDEANSEVFRQIGMVRGATFSDLTDNGAPDLVAVTEWGPIRLFTNDEGRFTPWDPWVKLPVGLDAIWNRGSMSKSQWQPDASAGRVLLSQLTGWWNSVLAADFDGDGTLDLAVGNWGENHGYQLYGRPLVAFFKPPMAGRASDMFLAYPARTFPWDNAWQPQDLLPVWGLARMSEAFPGLRDQFLTRRAFAEANVQEILGAQMHEFQSVEASWFQSGVLLNRIDHFVWKPFPQEAQWTATFGMGTADFDGDGHLDLYLAQNFFGEASGVPRLDAGVGLILRGKGDGTFESVPPEISGIRVDEEQRGVAIADYDGDNRPDLAIRLGNGQVKVFRNQRGQPGTSVRLPTGEPNGPMGMVGATFRLLNDEIKGPVQQVVLGSGYGSVDDVRRILTLPGVPTALEIGWPGEKKQILPLSNGGLHVEISRIQPWKPSP